MAYNMTWSREAVSRVRRWHTHMTRMQRHAHRDIWIRYMTRHLRLTVRRGAVPELCDVDH